MLTHRYLGTDTLAIHLRDGGVVVTPGCQVDLDLPIAVDGDTVVTLRQAVTPAYLSLFDPIEAPPALSTAPRSRARVVASTPAAETED